MADEKDTVERAKEILVYGPIGLAMYMRDTAPSFLKVFVARGRAEVEQRKRSVGDHLGQAREMGESATETGGPQVLRLVTEGLAKVKETADGALGALGGLGADMDRSDRADTANGEGGSDGRAAAAPPGSHAAEGSTSAPSKAASVAHATRPHLPIADYDDLSASQVVDRLEGLDASDLEAIRAHEIGNRARATILGKIDQLTRAG